MKFDEPLQTKSGLDIVHVWNRLKECKKEYHRAKSDQDHTNAHNHALEIVQLQKDIGLKEEKFPELNKAPL